MYYTTTKDFENFSETKLFVEPGFNVIDATIAKNENEYFMIIKDENLIPEAKKKSSYPFLRQPLRLECSVF